MNRFTLKLSGMALATTLAVAASSAMGAEIGIGAGIADNSSWDDNGSVYTLSMPIRFDSFTLEPDVGFYRYRGGNSSGKSMYKGNALDIGLYWHLSRTDALETYLGGRVGLDRYKSEYMNPWGSNYSTSYGYHAGPTIGAEYFFAKNFSLGLDLTLMYKALYTESGGSGGYTVWKASSKSYDSQSRVRLRAYF